MSTLLQVSDPHFGTEVPEVVDALVALAARVAPTLVVLSGDITQRATPDEFRAATDFVARLGAPPTLAIPGNHDIPLLNLAARILSPFARYRRAFGSEEDVLHSDPKLFVVGVNTVVPRWHKDGAVSADRIDRVSVHLRSARDDQVRIVVCHHPALVIRPEDLEDRLHGADAAIRRWVDDGADLILGGHIHMAYVRSLKDSVPDLARQAWAVQAGTAVSSRTRSGFPNSVNLIRPIVVDGGVGCCVERWDYVATTRAFEIVTADRLRLDRTPLPAVLTSPGASGRGPPRTPA